MKIYLHHEGEKTTSRGIFNSIPQSGNLSITFVENNLHAFWSQPCGLRPKSAIVLTRNHGTFDG